jgi:acyl-CoA synthetase (AMP-forming)/AMP-acid ligase II
MDFTALICHHALSQPERPAIILPDRVVTYGMFARGMLAVEERLAGLRLQPGALVAVAIESPIRHLIVVAALFRRGHPSLSVRRTRDIPPVGLPLGLILEGSADAMVPGQNQILVGDDWFTDETRDFSAAPSGGFADDRQVARVELSSGTTGMPKAISLSVHALHRWIQNYYSFIGLGDWSRVLLLPGLSSSWGFTVAAHALNAGKTLCFAASARETLNMIALHRIDCLVAATQHLLDLVDEQRRAPAPCTSLRVVLTGGSSLSRALLTESRAALCSDLFVLYGSTEAGGTAYARAERLVEIDGAVGFVAPWAEVQALDEARNILSPDTEGILRIQADCLGRPYPDGPPTVGDSIRDGWFYPGDRGRIRADGLLIVSGRVSEIINAGGTKLAPELIEEVARRHPSVADAAAVGGIGASGIEEVWLAVVARAGVADRDVVDFCAGNGIPVARIVRVDAIPRTATGKVERARLKSEILAR